MEHEIPCFPLLAAALCAFCQPTGLDLDQEEGRPGGVLWGAVCRRHLCSQILIVWLLLVQPHCSMNDNKFFCGFES